MVTRRYEISRYTSVRQHERITVETDVDVAAISDGTEAGERALDAFLDAHGEMQSAEVFVSADDLQLAIEIEDVKEVPEPEPVQSTLPVPYPPTTAVQAVAWVRWAETEIGLGWHPDTPGEDLITNGVIGLEARCACGETFNPNDLDDTIHGEREDGEPCGLRGVVVSTWGAAVPLLTGDALTRYNDGLAAAHELLPDIYATASEILRSLHPDLLATTKGV